MQVFEKTIAVNSNRHCEMIDITREVEQFVAAHNVKQGQVHIFCPHTTAAITINENADPDVQDDIILTLGRVFPKDANGYKHCEGNSDSHVKSSLVGASESILISGGKLVLGVWQGIYFCEFDGPRSRKTVIHIHAID